MLSNQEVRNLLNLPKILKDKDFVVDLRKKKNRIELISDNEVKQEFAVEITTNDKILLKTTIHHFEKTDHIGLLRIDFKGTHQNPNYVTENLPPFLLKYLNKFFTPEEHHLHIYFEGYKPLAWAIPLKDINFPILNLENKMDVSDLLHIFAEKINIKTQIKVITSFY